MPALSAAGQLRRRARMAMYARTVALRSCGLLSEAEGSPGCSGDIDGVAGDLLEHCTGLTAVTGPLEG